MKITINKNLLESVIVNAIPFLEKKDLSSITSHILISAFNNTLEIKATDYEIGFKYNLRNFEIEEEGTTTVNGKKLLEILKSLNNQDLSLNSNENYLNIKQNKAKFRIPNFNHIAFPSFPTLEAKKHLNANPVILSKSFKKIYPAIDINNPKPELNGALIDIKENYINFVGTDTRRLALCKYDLESPAEEFKLIIPRKAIAELQKIFLLENEDKIEIYYDENIFLAKNSNFEFFTKLINGKYPNYEAVVPKDLDFNFDLKKDEIQSAIKTVSIMGEKVRISFERTGITLESINSNNNEAKDELPMELDLKDDLHIVFKNKHVLDFLSAIDEDDFTFSVNSPNSAFLVQTKSLTTVIMPMSE